MLRLQSRLINEQKQAKTNETSLLLQARNTLLSWFVPVDLALTLHDKFVGPSIQQGNFKKFSQELQKGLDITGNSPEFFINLIPEYLAIKLKNKMYTGELLAFREKVDGYLQTAYDPKISPRIQTQYKTLAFKTIMLNFGPRGLKYVQSMRSKDPNSWISDAVLTAQSDLPAVSTSEIETMLKQAFKAQGTINYVKHFSEHFEVLKVLGAGTVGITALINYKEKSDSPAKEQVAKFIRPGIIDELISDNEFLNQAADSLLAARKATAQEVAIFKELNAKKLAEILREANPNLENVHLNEAPYQGPGITTVRGNLDLAGKASNVVFMDKAQGVELGKYLKKMRKQLASSDLKETEQAHLAHLRKLYCSLAEIHFQRIAENRSVHADLHAGNLFYDEESQLLSVLDLGAIARPVSNADHLQLRQFLFSLQLSAGTADAEYLRMYYKKYYSHSEVTVKKIDDAKLESMLTKIQEKLTTIKHGSVSQKVVNSEKCLNEIINIITNDVLTNSPELIPSALIHLARSNQLLSEELEALNQDLAGSKFASQIPYSERTQLAISLRASLKLGRSKNAELWTQETWDYFSKNTLMLGKGLDQLKFEKKFIYGIFGFSDREAAMFDLLIPGGLISAPIVLFLAGKALHKGVKIAAVKIPEMAQSYQIIQKLKNVYGHSITTHDIYKILSHPTLQNAGNKIKNSVTKAKNFGNTILQNRAPVFQRLQSLTSLQQRLFANSTFRKFAPGVVVGAAAMYGIQKVYRKMRQE